MKTNLMMGVAGAVLLFAASAQAATFKSDLVNEASSVGSPTFVTAIDPAWDPNVLGAGAWVSYADTGVGGVPTGNDSVNPAMVYREDLTGAGFLNSLTLWADDTAAAFLYDSGDQLITQLIFIGDTTASGSGCIVGTPNCRPGGQGTFAGSVAFGAGSYIQFEAYQLYGEVFGIKYDGTTSPVPVPAALPLLLSGLAGLGFISRRKA